MAGKDDLLDLDRDLPTSRLDVEALAEVRRLPIEDYGTLMQALHDALPPKARAPRRTTSAGWDDFEL